MLDHAKMRGGGPRCGTYSEPIGGTGPGSGRRTLRYSIHPAIKSKRKGHDT